MTALSPQRIQLKRTKGWRMPPNTVKVDRATEWGNPWRVPRDGDGAYCAEQYRRCLTGTSVDAWPKNVSDTDLAVSMAPADIAAWLLRGKNLACWCRLCDRHRNGKPAGIECSECAPCHADVLLELANP